ncbi:MAG TPA: C25 family cysteine peptidase [Chitinispirillaceae bacterium]|nr:C25 family cysteine peptidase [Chitinispirillaceae bacterium]
MKSKIWYMFISCILLFSGASFTQIKVIESTASTVRLSWEIEGIDTVVLGCGNQKSVLLSFKGQNTVAGSAGEVSLPGYSVFTGIPPAGEITVSVVADQVSMMQLSADPLVKDPNDKSTSQKQPEFVSPWISQPVYERIRGIRTAVVIVRPVVYDKDSKMVRIMTRGTITITLPPGVHQTTITGTSEFETMLSQLLCNYPVAKGWRTFPGRLGKKKNSGAFPLDTKVYHFRVGDGAADFNEVTTMENGLMKIPGSVITRSFGIVPVSNVKLYASEKGELSSIVPDADIIPDGVVEIPLLRIDCNKDGIVDTADYFVAYVTGASDWTFENGSYKMNIDRYDDYRNYWLTTGNRGSSMGIFTGEELADTVIHHFVQPCYFKKSNDIPKKKEGGLERIWTRLIRSNRNFQEPQLSFTGIDTTLPGNLRIGFVLVHSGALRLKFGNINEVCEFDNHQYTVSSWGNQKVECEFDPQTDTSYCEIYDFSIDYFREMDVSERGMLTIFSMPDTFKYAYTIRGLDGHLVYIVKVSANDVVELVDTVRNSSDGTWSWVDRGMTGARYIVCREENLLPFPSHEEYHKSSFNVKHGIYDLRNVSNRTDYLIITHPDFAAQAETLAVHKEKMGFSNPVIVDIHDIYRLFSGGDVDPTAVRNFILYVKKRWMHGVDLDFVLLMGAGHYDYKKKMKNIPIYMPVYYDSYDELFDDYFAVTDPYVYPEYPSPSCAIGRITCATAREASNVVNKIREYEDPEIADFSAWRNRALFVADDDMQGNSRDWINDHHISSDLASDRLSEKWKSLDLRKVFLYEYEWDSSRRKPGATRAILNQINNGAGIVNYFGHGSYYLWSDEEVLNISDMGKLYNKKQYPVVSSFSCSVGKFDLPGSECLAGAIVKLESAGAIASISSSRSSSSSTNENLAVNFYGQLADTVKKMRSIGTMLTLAKIQEHTTSNRTYNIIGDPSVHLFETARNVELDIVDSKDSSLSKIKSMQLIKVKGKVLGSDGTIDNGYGSEKKPAYVQVGIFNPDDSASRKDGDTLTVKYVLPGSPVFIGKTRVYNGLFEQSVLIPKKVSFNKQGGKVTAFSWLEGKNDCGAGFQSGFVFNGTEDDVADDTSGPAISVQQFEFKKDNSSGLSKVDLSFQIVVYDPNGIDIVGTDPDEGLSVEIPGVLEKRNISNKIQFKEGEYKSGTAQVEVPVSSVNNGPDTLVITSRDLLGNLSVAKFPVDFSRSNIADMQIDLNLDHVCNFPNPVRLGQTTRFFFYRSEVNEQFIPFHYRFHVKIYTLNGKLVKVLKDTKNKVVWDCRDQNGRLLSPDVYLYQVHAYSSLSKKTVKSKIGKVVIHPPMSR